MARCSSAILHLRVRVLLIEEEWRSHKLPSTVVSAGHGLPEAAGHYIWRRFPGAGFQPGRAVTSSSPALIVAGSAIPGLASILLVSQEHHSHWTISCAPFDQPGILWDLNSRKTQYFQRLNGYANWFTAFWAYLWAVPTSSITHYTSQAAEIR